MMKRNRNKEDFFYLNAESKIALGISFIIIALVIILLLLS